MTLRKRTTVPMSVYCKQPQMREGSGRRKEFVNVGLEESAFVR